MSNVVSAITATDTGDRRIKSTKSKLFQDVFSVKETLSSAQIHGEMLKQYRIGVTIGSQCTVSEFDAAVGSVNPLHEAIGRTKRQVIEAIFGEFRQDIRAIERHLYNYEYEEAASALREMEQKMFSED
jgi:hypothetical protein